ncbi:MAG: Stk1 family PASTA domain-containing Ser/Thr kinase [Actinobacteria bacterium]|nr:Stk1 family PASTA domain-containing Ser/Thr kinase [Actinomycetota bacterium]
MGDLVGEVLSHRYRLVARIAGGGMGEVYRGHDLLLDRTVAVKVLQPSLAADPDLVQRFKAEARAAARLSHPNIVAVHDWGAENDKTYYMVMEYVAGSDLRDLLVSRGSVEPAQAAAIMASVCEALYVAHSRGLVHRDVKPENILLARDGTVKVADFGIAAMVDAERTAPGGTIPGTLRYLSPEQARGEDATSSSDIWAAGAMLCELLTGAPPGSGSGVDLIRRRATEGIERPSAMRDDIPKELDDIVMKACALETADRYVNADLMARDLREVAGDIRDVPPVDVLLDHVTGEIRLPDMEPTTFVSGRSRRKQLRKRKLRARLLIVIPLVLLLVLSGVAAAKWLFAPQMVPVPDLEGKKKATAAELAGEQGLKLEVVDKQRTGAVRPGEIIEQSPARGEVEEGSTIEIVISAGYPKLPVPDVVGLTLKATEARLRVHKLEPGKVSYSYSPKPRGTVIAQKPADGALAWYRTVDLEISKGPEPVTVPDVTNKSAAAASRALKAAGFAPNVVEAFSDDVAKGKVISTDPAGGQVIGKGSEVRIYVSIGPEFKELKMPDLRGSSLSDAQAKLKNLGLRYRVIQSCAGGSTVVETDPIAGTTVRENDKVALFVC